MTKPSCQIGFSFAPICRALHRMSKRLKWSDRRQLQSSACAGHASEELSAMTSLSMLCTFHPYRFVSPSIDLKAMYGCCESYGDAVHIAISRPRSDP